MKAKCSIEKKFEPIEVVFTIEDKYELSKVVEFLRPVLGVTECFYKLQNILAAYLKEESQVTSPNK